MPLTLGRHPLRINASIDTRLFRQRGQCARMELDALRIFVKVAERASFTGAALQLGLAKTRVSAAVAHLETQLGTRLLHRTTRRVRLTQDGEQFLERCQALLADADELQGLFQRTAGTLRGKVRVDLPTRLARNIVIPRLPQFLAEHSQLEIELSTTDRRVDLVGEGFDCVVRVGALPDSELVARRLGVLRQINCASPAYLRAHGTPRTLDDLDQHRLVRYAPTLGASALGWEYREGDRVRQRAMRGTITVNNSDAYEAACLAGLGLVQAPALGVRRLIDDGSLVEVMPAFVSAPMPVSLLYAHRHHQPKRVQALMAWLAETLMPHLD
jgi:DNA-binding transcriptional LysR family regulator